LASGSRLSVDHDPLLIEEDRAEDIGIEPMLETRAPLNSPVRVVRNSMPIFRVCLD